MKRLIACGAVTIGMLVSASLLVESRPADALFVLVELLEVPNCEASDVAVDWAPRWAGSDHRYSAMFDCEGAPLQVEVGVWLAQVSGKEAVSEQNRLLPDRYRFVTTVERREWVDGYPVVEYDVNLDGESLVVWRWYVVGERRVASDFGVKALEAAYAVFDTPKPTAVIALGARAGTPEAARALLAESAPAVSRWYRSGLGS